MPATRSTAFIHFNLSERGGGRTHGQNSGEQLGGKSPRRPPAGDRGAVTAGLSHVQLIYFAFSRSKEQPPWQGFTQHLEHINDQRVPSEVRGQYESDREDTDRKRLSAKAQSDHKSRTLLWFLIRGSLTCPPTQQAFLFALAIFATPPRPVPVLCILHVSARLRRRLCPLRATRLKRSGSGG